MSSDPFRAMPGAVSSGEDILHFGNPFGEQRALAEGRAVVPLTDRAVLTVAGEDRLSWLDSLSSQALRALEPGRSMELLVLDPNGHVEHAASVVDDGERTWLVVDRADAEALLTHLVRMRFRLRVDPQDVSDRFRVLGGAPAALPTVASSVVWEDPWPEVSDGGWGYAVVAEHPGRARRWAEVVVTREAYEHLAAEAAQGRLEVAGLLAAEALRIAAWRPRVAAEADGRTLPHEADWLRTAVHLNKGCYRGQETVAKVHNLGHPPRRLVALQLDGSDADLPEPGAVVRAEGAEVGHLTSVARHYEEGPVALALVKRSLPVDAALTVAVGDAEVAAVQEAIVPPDAGSTADVPRLPRLSRRR